MSNARSAGIVTRSYRSFAPKPIDPCALSQEAEPVVILGGGMAGLSAALWCWRLRKKSLVIDQGNLGGQLHLIHFPIPDLVGEVDTADGHRLAQRCADQFGLASGRWLRGRVLAIEDHQQQRFRILAKTQTDTVHISATTVIVATGVRRRMLNVPGESELIGKGILETASRDIGHLSGSSVVVVGGGDAACENAQKLAAANARVTLVYRRKRLRARPHFRQAVEQHPHIRLLPNCSVDSFEATSGVLGAVKLDNGDRINATAALVRVGWVPNSAMVPPAWTDSRGYIRCAMDLAIPQTDGAFVAGDIRNPPSLSLAAAAGDGACAAASATRLLDSKI